MPGAVRRQLGTVGSRCWVGAGWVPGGCWVGAGWVPGGCRVGAGWVPGAVRRQFGAVGRRCWVGAGCRAPARLTTPSPRSRPTAVAARSVFLAPPRRLWSFVGTPVADGTRANLSLPLTTDEPSGEHARHVQITPQNPSSVNGARRYFPQQFLIVVVWCSLLPHSLGPVSLHRQQVSVDAAPLSEPVLPPVSLHLNQY